MKKNILLLGVVVVFALFLVKGTKIQSVDEYYLTHMEDIKEDSETVTVSIRCDTLLQPENWKMLKKQLRKEKYVPKDGVILKESTYVLREGDTAFDLTKRACQYNKIQMEYSGPDTNLYSTVFIQGINHLYDHSCGELSGWMFRLNGKFPSRGPSAVELKDGDKVEWVYTCDLGRDVGDDYMDKQKQKMLDKTEETEDTKTKEDTEDTKKTEDTKETEEAK